jgi:DNA-binding IscR family transcriptional regulator
MLSITTKSPYAVRALTELARSGGAGPVPIGEAAAAARAVLENATIAELVERENRQAGAHMYYI